MNISLSISRGKFGLVIIFGHDTQKLKFICRTLIRPKRDI